MFGYPIKFVYIYYMQSYNNISILIQSRWDMLTQRWSFNLNIIVAKMWGDIKSQYANYGNFKLFTESHTNL